MRKESAIIRKCSAQRTGEPFHYASIQHILSNVMNAGILRSGETKSEVFPELQIVSLEQFNRVAKTREQRSVNYAIKCGGTTETVQLEDGTEATVVRPPRAYPRKIVGKALLSGNVYCGHCGGRIFAATARKTHRPTETEMRKESAIIRKCSAQRTGEPFHYASIQHILSNVMNAGILRSGETKSEVFPELQIVSLEQFNRVAKTREQRSVNYAIKCGGTTETVQLEDGTEATVVRPPRAYPRKIVGKALLSGNVYCGHCGGRIFAATARKTHRPTESNERIAIYKCYNRSQHKGQCDGPSTYRAEKVDKVIEQLLRGIFERAKKVDEKTILKMLVDASAEQCQQELKAAKLEYTKTMKELSRWGDLMLDSLDGTCVFTPEQVKARLDAVQAKADEIAHQVQQLEEKSRQMKPAAADLLREHQQILTWAELFDSAAIEEKKVIASYLIKAVTLTRGYGIQVDFNISEAQFLNGLEMG